MSNYIYNDDFSSNGPEPIRLQFKSAEKSKQKMLPLIAVCFLLAGLFIFLGGLFSFLSSKVESEGNLVYTNSYYVSQGNTVSTLSSSSSRADIIDKIKPSVVEIQTQYVVQSYYQYVTGGAGSGVIVGKYIATDDGDVLSDNGTEIDEGDIVDKGYYIITNAHVIEGANSNEIASEITVTLTDGSSYPAKVKGYDSIGDIAVLMISEPAKELTCATFAGNDTVSRVGDAVIAIGNPLGELGGTVTNGYISALDREIEIDGTSMNLLQTDAAINPGNSGGGLFNLNGELIGIVNAKSSGTGIEGLGFAIPCKDALKIYTDFLNYGYVTGRPNVGITFTAYYNNPYPVIAKISDDSPNKEALEIGDQIVGIRVKGESEWTDVTASSLGNYIRKCDIGDILEFRIIRADDIIAVEVLVYENKGSN